MRVSDKEKDLDAAKIVLSKISEENSSKETTKYNSMRGSQMLLQSQGTGRENNTSLNENIMRKDIV